MNRIFLFRALAGLCCLACARGFIITPPGGRHDTTSRQIALFTALVSTDDYYLAGNTNMVLDAAVAICTARHYGSKMPFLLDFANLRGDHVEMLAGLGWKVHNVTDSIGMWQSKYKPVYNKTQALQEHRPWTDQHVQNRRDGWATYFKFKAWTHEEYDKILISDADVIWRANPDPVLEGPGSDFVFQTFLEKADRTSKGLNTHLMIITPSKDTYEKLVEWASSGAYLPYTNTEQDVLESHFRGYRNGDSVMGLFKHRHTHSVCLDAGRLARVQTCEDIWRACREPPRKSHGIFKPLW